MRTGIKRQAPPPEAGLPVGGWGAAPPGILSKGRRGAPPPLSALQGGPPRPFLPVPTHFPFLPGGPAVQRLAPNTASGIASLVEPRPAGNSPCPGVKIGCKRLKSLNTNFHAVESAPGGGKLIPSCIL